jgi:hypothetical protein
VRKASASLSSTSETVSTSSRRFSAAKASISAGISAVTTFSLKNGKNSLQMEQNYKPKLHNKIK